MGNLAIITARGGSKRIPNKNIRDFCGKPIIYYSIRAAIESEVFDEIMVSTDSKRIAEVAMSFGAKVPFMRSDEKSNDTATTSDVILEVIEEYKKLGREFTYGCCIYPTAPFVNGKKIVQGMKILKESEVDSVIPMISFSYPPQRGFHQKHGYMEMINPQNKRVRSQDLEKVYHDAGQFYCFRVESFTKTKDLLSGNIKSIILDELEVQDIDEETDWKLAELKYKLITDGVYN